MLYVRTELKPSTIEGNGLFAAERIREGQVIWSFTPGLDIVFPRNLRESLDPVIQDFLNKYCSRDGEYLIVYADNARFINHSRQSNTRWEDETAVLVAARDIETGEEITEDYYVVEWAGLDTTNRPFE
jgi:SET domain-containing protein